MPSPQLTIEHCTSCNYLPRALWIAAELLPTFQFDVSAFTLKPGDRGVFEIRVNDQTVFSKAVVGRFPEPDDLRQAVGDAVEKIGAG